MQDTRTTAVVYAFRPTLPALLVGLVGLIALVLGVVSPAQAGGSSGKGANDDKPWICHPVEGNGELGNGWNLINPDQASRHIDEKTGKGMHTRKDGSTDRYAVKSGGKWVCKDRDREDEDNGDDHDNRWVCHPLDNGEWRLVPPEYAPRHITEEGKGLHTKAGNTDQFAKKVGDKWVCPEADHETPKPTKTSTPTQTSTPTMTPPETGGFTPPATSTTTAPEQAPTVPEQAPVLAPVQAAAPSNVVPAAQTDGADLQGSSPLQPVLVGSGALLMMAAGLLSLRRRQVY